MSADNEAIKAKLVRVLDEIEQRYSAMVEELADVVRENVRLREDRQEAERAAKEAREERDMLRSELEDGMGRTWREDRDKARALLAEVERVLWQTYPPHHMPELSARRDRAIADVRAFLAGERVKGGAP